MRDRSDFRGRRGDLTCAARRRLAAALLCAYAAVACGRHDAATPAAGRGRSAHAGHVYRPPAAAPWSARDRARVGAALATIFASDITTEKTGIAVLAADGSPLFMRRATVPVTPASTLKLVIASTALDALGPAHRFETRFVATAPPDADGTLRGGLWLVGGGDPMLTSGDLRRGVGVLARSGVKQIDAPLEIDDTSFAGPEQNPRWDPGDLSYDYAAGTSAVALDDGVVEFDVSPSAPGDAARVNVVPENDAITFDGTVRTAPAGATSFVTIERKPQPPGSPNAVDARDAYVVDGRIAQGETQKYFKPILGMPGYVGGALATMLAQRGIALAAGYRVGAAPAGAQVLWDHPSPPLAAILRDMLVYSNNHTAETLLRIVGERIGKPGTDEAGIAVERRDLARLGVPTRGMRVYDGSGLAPSDRITSATLASVIAAQVRGPAGDVFIRSLPRVGLEGTVKHHDLHAALGRTRAKSGHIENVNGLAGTVLTAHHGRVAFAFIVNDPRANADVVTDEEDRALDALAAS